MDVRSLVEEVDQVPDARPEHDEVDDREGGERSGDSGGGDRGDAVSGTEQPVDREGLPPGLGDRPASGDGNQAGRSHGDREAVEPSSVVEPVLPSQPERGETEGDHKQAEPDHDPERPEHERQVSRPSRAGHVLKPAHGAVQVVREIEASEARDTDGSARLAGLGVGPSEQ